MVLSVAQAYFKTAFNSRSIVDGIISILTVDYIDIEMSSMWNFKPWTIINSFDHQAFKQKGAGPMQNMSINT